MTVTHGELRHRLQEEREHLTRQLEQLQADAFSPKETREGSPFGKKEEGATETFELEKRLALEKRAREHLSEIERALRKFEQGTYGLCDVCGQPIGTERLEALPQVNLCLNCKSHQARDAKIKFPAR